MSGLARDQIMRITADNFMRVAVTKLDKEVARDAVQYGEDRPREWLTQVAEHGCQSGMVPGMTTTAETAAFYEARKDDIWAMLGEMGENSGGTPLEVIAGLNGAGNVMHDSGFKNLLAWMAYDETARRLLERAGQTQEATAVVQHLLRQEGRASEVIKKIGKNRTDLNWFLNAYSGIDPETEIELRCYLQDNRLASGEEVDNPDEHWDSIVVKARDLPKLTGLWLDYCAAEDDHHAFQSQDLFVTELEGALEERGVPYQRM